jgi:hypothetical protein
MGDRYAPGAEDGTTERSEIYCGDAGNIAVIDRRARWVSPVPGTAMSILHRTSKVLDAQTGEPVVEAHAYRKLIVPDALFAQQFAEAGLELTNVGGVADLSPYHRGEDAAEK